MVSGTIRVAMWAAVAGCAFAMPAQAQGNGPGFHASVFSNGCTGGNTASSTTPPASVGPMTLPCVSGSATGAGEADAGSLRASGRSVHVCCGSGSWINGRSRIQIENVIITGPDAASIPVSLNFQLRGALAGNPDFGQAGVVLFVGLSGFNTLLSSTSEIYMSPNGILNQTGVFAPLAVAFPNATIDQSFTSPSVNAAPNQPLRLDFELLAWSDMAGLGATDSDFFSGTNGLSLPVGIPVFNLPDGYTIHIPALNIVDNLWQATVPPAVSVTPSDLNFGSVAVGSQSTSLVTVTNTGGPGLQVSAINLAPPGTAFSIVSLKKEGVNAVPPVLLDTNQTLDVEVAFTPATVGAAAAALLVSSNADAQSAVQLAGNGEHVETPPSEQIASLLSFFDFAAGAGLLQGTGPGNSAAGRLKALRNMIQAAADVINQSNFTQACLQLQDVLSRVDHGPRPPDFASGPSVEEIRSRVADVRASLGCP